MRYPTGEKEWGRGSCKIQRIIAVEEIHVKKIPGMVKSHNNHYQSTQQVNGGDAGFGTCHAAKVEFKT